MTTLLQRAVAEVEKLPPEDQDAIAARFLAEVEDERQWGPASPQRPMSDGTALSRRCAATSRSGARPTRRGVSARRALAVNSVITAAFRERLGLLPDSVREQATRAYALCRRPTSPEPPVQTGQSAPADLLGPRRPGVSCTGALERDTITWFSIGSHADYDTLVARI